MMSERQRVTRNIGKKQIITLPVVITCNSKNRSPTTRNLQLEYLYSNFQGSTQSINKINKTSICIVIVQPRGATGRSTSKVTKGIVNCQYSMAVFSLSSGERKRKPRGDRKSQERSIQLKHAMEAIIHLELYPRSQIDIYVEVLQVDGSEYCASVNAATLALIDAGIPIKNYAVGCTVTKINSPSLEDEDSTMGTGVLDANYVEECAPGVTLSVVALPNSDNVSKEGLIVVAQGAGQRLHLSQLESLKSRALYGCQDIKTILDCAVRQYLTEQSLPSLFHVTLD